MFDLKVLNSALAQLEEERGIPKEKILEAIEDALSAAYKKDFGKKGQIVRAKFELGTGTTNFYRVKTVVDENTVRFDDEEEDERNEKEESEQLPRYNEEHHMLIEDAKKIRADVKCGDEITFPLESKDDYGRIAAQTAKQVIIQRIREAEKISVLDEYLSKTGEIITGSVQRVERGNVFIDLGRTTAILPKEEQIPGEYYRQGERIKAYLLSVEETGRGIDMRLSRSHPQFLAKLFEVESPEIANGAVTIESIAREAGARSKIAVLSHDENIDSVGSLVGQRGIRVNTLINELGGEKIDIIEWSSDPVEYISHALSPAKVINVEVDKEKAEAKATVEQDQFSLAIGRGGQNVRLAAKLTGYRLDVVSTGGETLSQGPNNTETEEDKIDIENSEKDKQGKIDKENNIEKVEEEKATDNKTKENIDPIEEENKNNKSQ